MIEMGRAQHGDGSCRLIGQNISCRVHPRRQSYSQFPPIFDLLTNWDCSSLSPPTEAEHTLQLRRIGTC